MEKHLQVCASAEALIAAQTAAVAPWVGYDKANKNVAYKGKN